MASLAISSATSGMTFAWTCPVRGLGFRFVHDDWHGRVWIRGPVNLDLHRRLPGVQADPAIVFSRLYRDAVPLELGRGSVRVPSEGYYEIWTRATDSRGVMQPHVAGNWNPQGYGGNPMHRVAIRVA